GGGVEGGGGARLIT
ncbi:unnamed protein product, partial [Rotaria magnacalcarata]